MKRDYTGGSFLIYRLYQISNNYAKVSRFWSCRGRWSSRGRLSSSHCLLCSFCNLFELCLLSSNLYGVFDSLFRSFFLFLLFSFSVFFLCSFVGCRRAWCRSTRCSCSSWSSARDRVHDVVVNSLWLAAIRGRGLGWLSLRTATVGFAQALL